MNVKKNIILIFALVLTTFGCRESVVTDDVSDLTDITDWTNATHSNLIEPNYSTVFEQDVVLRFDIIIDSEDWSDMQSDLSSNIGSFGGPGQIGTSDYTPIWVPCSFYFNGIQWYNVGIRHKGNSSLISTYHTGNNKLPFKLDFDEFENEYPILTDQRFYGFRQLSLKNNFEDASLMREKVASDLFINFGLASAKTAYCEVYIDHGSGSQYYGVYTLVEEVDDTVLEDQFFNSTGNLYKPEGDAATFASGTFDEFEMDKKNNLSGDYSDVEALCNIINSSNRTSNIDLWKSELSAVFNVDGFIKWLAANTVMQNWDTYGKMSHNYYLYNNPDDNKLTWIPWDNNEALRDGKQGGALSLSLNEVGSIWPLIKYLMDVEEYEQIYKTYVLQFIEEVFNPSNLQSVYDNYYQLLKDYAYAEQSGYSFLSSESDFDQAVETLKNHVQLRNVAVQSYLD
ncbi:MAG: CotH kinase family protein [Candidatus Marinimicrobia bacterium]|nr:CotH kinase family protein [Candidatus Neomarinimicrobiota bacterium]